MSEMHDKTRDVAQAIVPLIDHLLALFTAYGIDIDEPTENGRSFRDMGIDTVFFAIARRVEGHYEQQKQAVVTERTA